MERRLYRSRHNRVILGVCGGLGEYFHTDPVIIRVIAVLLIIPGIFPAVIAYFILALIIPVEGSTAETPRESFRENVNDMRDTTSGLEKEIRTTLGNKENKTGLADEPPPGTPPQHRYNSNRGFYFLGLIIIAIGVFFLLITVFGWFWRFLWPVLLIAAGLIIVVLAVRRR